jgi:hypothetical protein
MMSNRNHKIDITVHNAVIADEDGVTAFWPGKSIPVWPRVSDTQILITILTLNLG